MLFFIFCALLSVSGGFQFEPVDGQIFLQDQYFVSSANSASSASDGNGTWIVSFHSYPSAPSSPNIHLARYNYLDSNWDYQGAPFEKYYSNITAYIPRFYQSTIAVCGNIWMIVFDFMESSHDESGYLKGTTYLLYSTSPDGKDWTEPELLRSEFLSNPFLLWVHSGLVLKCNPHSKEFMIQWISEGEIQYSYYSWYRNRTTKWSTPQQLTSDFYGTPAIEPTNNSNWMAVFQCGEGSASVCFVTINSDYVASEPQTLSPLSTEASVCNVYYSPTIKSDGRKTFVGWIANCEGTDTMWFISSEDFGLTWSNPFRVWNSSRTLLTSCPCKMATDGRGKWAMTFFERGELEGINGLSLITTTTNWERNNTVQNLYSRGENIIMFDEATLDFDGKGNWAVWWTSSDDSDRYLAVNDMFYMVNRETESTDLSSSSSDISGLSGLADRNAIIIASTVCSAALIIAAAAVAFVFHRRRKSKAGHHVELELTSSKFSAVQEPGLIARSEMIGSGNFGRVYKSIIDGKQVAVKAVGILQEVVADEIRKEVGISMLLPPHPNVVQFFGVFVDKGEILITMEFCGGGSLDKFLQNNVSIDTKQQIIWARDIARGMNHIHTALEGIQVIHRDLAARNVLLKDDLTAAICDFGMSRTKNDSSTYARTKTSLGPLKWMAPESILHNKYSTASDVFSYGVVLFEILSGKQPWREVGNAEAAHRVLEGKRLQRPPNSNEFLATIMEKCWDVNPDLRPSFAQIVSALEKAA
eukprot:TRINITY_DN11049_c0_g1_i5.p1 TRINITY_DN11049_c0_g1~~TRINITY_DN11049_c0_g1_i5.p1  ORF type:complete len:755 (+),score=95.77 TRINITY_DN11049_c0_g1_i5:40-2304(+)